MLLRCTVRAERRHERGFSIDGRAVADSHSHQFELRTISIDPALGENNSI